MNVRFLIFISVVIGILSLASFYVGARFIAVSPWGGGHRKAVWLTLGSFVCLQLLGPFVYRTFPDRRLEPLYWLIYLSLGVFVCLFFYMAAADLLGLAWRIFFGPGSSFVTAQRWLFAVAGGMVAVSVAVGIVQATRGPRVFQVNVPIQGLPETFDGFRIAQISDLHVGPTIGREYVERVVTLVNDLNPDAIALTGDLIDGTVERLRDQVVPLRNLKARYGVFYVIGNHECYWGPREWAEEFRRLGFQVLWNEHSVIEKDGRSLAIAGVTDDQAEDLGTDEAPSVAKAAQGVPEEAVKILLSHRPSHYEEAVKEGFRLELSGHTHGGQFFPWSLVVGMAYKFTKGLHRFENLWIYVSRGTGYWGPPIRFGVPGEVTLLCLKRG